MVTKWGACNMFRGGFIHSLDEKNRIIIPQKFRMLLGEKFVITKGLDKCLWVFGEEEYRNLDEHLKAQPMLDQNAVRLQRFFTAEAVDATTDFQGRVALPSNLRDYSGIDKETMIVGAGNRIEIWSKTRWDDITNALTDDIISEAAKMIGLG
ncbi:MAG: division/cell wall cluster transcriptional repressor MraZ [Armatimonadota bacterium]